MLILPSHHNLAFSRSPDGRSRTLQDALASSPAVEKHSLLIVPLRKMLGDIKKDTIRGSGDCQG